MAAGAPTERFEPVIGLEIHVQLSTRTKMFCGCELSFGDPPNTHTCPVCLGHPGALPVTNGEAVRLAVLAGLALGCEVPPTSEFHRKNYFYPDLAKAYQISQYDEPLCVDGRFRVLLPGGRELEVGITRAHLEEDAAKLVHVGAGGRRAGAEASGVDFNRAGTPLLEIVTEPDLRAASDASAFLRQLRQTLRTLGVSDCNMEEGSLRADANVSVRPMGYDGLGTKAELKNMNSFRFLERGMGAEIARQVALLDAGERVVQETLHFDPDTGEIHPLRSKEEAHDYRYFPEPDLVPLAPDPAWVERLRAELPELPVDRRRRWAKLGLTYEDAEVLSETAALGDYFEAVAARTDPKAAANWIRGELRAQLRELGQEPWDSRVTPERLAELIGLRADRTLSEPLAKEVLAEVARSGASPRAVVEKRGLGQISDDGELSALVERLLEENPAQADQLRGGKDKLVGYFVGQAMKATGGRADPARVGELVRERAGV
jgi:aspartyl-tRNA(Asn)/glutamyl-tRNA(Gln) amidotransferase subunit B